MSHKCRNCGADVDDERTRELPLANETRVVYKCGEIEYFDMGVHTGFTQGPDHD